jgi:hypothetical protein
VPVTAQDDVDVQPGLAQQAQHGGDELARQPLEEKQRQVAMALVVMVVEGQLLLVGPEASALASSSGARSSANLNMGSRRRLLASLPST